MIVNTAPSLPLEIIDMVFQHAHKSALASVIQCNTLIYPLACRALYRTLETSPNVRKYISLLKTLCLGRRFINRSDRIALPALFVRTVTMDFSQHFVTANLLRLVHCALSYLPNLLDLRIEFSLKDNRFHLGWVLGGCTLANAQLERLSTSVRCDSILSTFLETQPKIADLCLRGFQLNEPHTVFTLSPSALPCLSGFRIVHAGMPVLGAVMKRRPVEAVGLTLFREDCYRALDTVALSTKPIKRLTLLSLDETDNTRPDILLHAVSSRMPDLEALHIIVLLASYTTNDLLAGSEPLKRLHSLKHLTFMAGNIRTEGVIQLGEGERKVVTEWTNACPSLKTVILPKGQMWCQKEGKWISSGEKENEDES